MNKKKQRLLFLTVALLLLGFFAFQASNMAIVNPQTVANCDSLTNFTLGYDGTYTVMSLDTSDKVEGSASVSCSMIGTGIYRLELANVPNLISKPILAFDIKDSRPSVILYVHIVSYSTAYMDSWYAFTPST